MADYLVKLANNPLARRVVRGLGLPLPMPTLLRRGEGPWQREPLRGQLVVVGGADSSELRGALVDALFGAGASVRYVGPENGAGPWLEAGRRHDRPTEVGDAGEGARADALVFDASVMSRVEDLSQLHRVLEPWLSRLSASGRVVVVARPPHEADDPEGAAVAQALEGFVRSLAKEVGRRGSTAQLVQVSVGAEARSVPVLGFLLSPRSAFVSGQVFGVSSEVRAEISAMADGKPLGGRTALVTGAARGIGAAIARTLAREGAHVVCLDRADSTSDLDTLAREIGGSSLAVDVSAADAADRIVAHVHDLGGKLDGVIHNAGVTRDKTLARMTSEQWDTVMAVNLQAICRITPRLLETVVPDGGRIVCLSSTSGIAGNYGQTNYAASKAGVIGYVRALAPRVAPRGIGVNAVAPGFIETRMTAAMPVAMREVGRRLNALGQGGEPRDVAEVVAFLASSGAVGLTGQIVRVCGSSLVGA